MFQEIQDRLQWRIELTLAGHYARLADQYRYPLTLHLDGGTQVMQNHAEMCQFFDWLRADWKARGVRRLRVEVTAVGEPRYGRFRVWATLREYGASNWLLGQRNYVQLCRRGPKGLCTELFETVRASAIETWPAQAADRRNDG